MLALNFQFWPVGALLLVASVLSACAGGTRPAPDAKPGVERVTLTPAQNQLVESGVRQMVESPSAKLSAVTATRLPKKPGVHVCGFVSKPGPGGKPGTDQRFYVELREADGKPVTERGQVGSTPSKLSKVNFVCRYNQ
ncbi:MAG: hypothetical protein AAGF14_05185 [Pseudomonadota bacterium]